MSETIYCPANQSTQVLWVWYFGIYRKYTIKVDITSEVTAKKYWNGIPYTWHFSEITYVNAYTGYTSVYLTPPANCYATVGLT